MLRTLNDNPSQPARLRAVVEISDGEVKIFPIADTDEEAEQVFVALKQAGRFSR